MEPTTIEGIIKSKLDNISKEIMQLMADSNCIGYTFSEQEVKVDNKGIKFTSGIGLRMLFGTETKLIGANVIYTKGGNGSGKTYVNLNVDYQFERGRDVSLRLSDIINFVDGDNRSRDSERKISTTSLIFNEVERMIAPLVAKSPMPFM